MKTVLHGNVDGYEIITGFADATIDPAATKMRIAPMLPNLPEQKPVDEINERIRRRMQKVVDDFTGIFGHDPFELRSPAEQDWFGKAKFECNKDIEALSSVMREPFEALQAARQKFEDDNPVYCQPGEHEMVISDEDSSRLIPIFVNRSDSEQVQLDGTLIPDHRGKRFYNSNGWSDRVISRLGDVPTDTEIHEADLTDNQRQAIADTKEAARFGALSAVERESEAQTILDSLASQAAVKKDEAIIKGAATDIALRNAQSWYKAEAAKVEQKYGIKKAPE